MKINSAQEIIKVWKTREDVRSDFQTLATFSAYCQNGGEIADASPSATSGPSAPTDAAIARLWESDAKLRAEFLDDFASFAAFQKADAAGLIKIYAPKK